MSDEPKRITAREAAKPYIIKQMPLVTIGRAEDVHRLLKSQLANLEQECFWVIAVDVRNGLVGHEMISKGSVHSVEVVPRDVFRYAIRINATAVILAHNHPSGDATPSSEDVEITKRFRDVGRIIGIPVIDHVVLTNGGRFVSIAEYMGTEF